MTRLQRLERECSQLWQEAQQAMWRGQCMTCPWHHVPTSAHHIIKRRFHATKFAMMNGITLCPECHSWAEDKPSAFLAWLKRRWPPLWLWHLEHKNPEPVRFTEAYLLETRAGLKQAIKELG